MTLRRFHGSYDLDKLAPADLLRFTKALAKLEAMAAAGVIAFEISVARPRKVRPAPSGRLQPQRQKIVDTIAGERWWTAREVSDTLGLNRNSANAQLSQMAQAGVVEMSERAVGGTAEGAFRRKTVKVFRAARSPG